MALTMTKIAHSDLNIGVAMTYLRIARKEKRLSPPAPLPERKEPETTRRKATGFISMQIRGEQKIVRA